MTVRRPIAALPIAPALIELLRLKGFESTDELSSLTSDDLCKDLDLGLEEASEVLRVALGSQLNATPFLETVLPPTLAPVIPATQTASQLLRPTSKPTFSSLSKDVDSLLSPVQATVAGVKQGMILEVSGPPGVGKTAAVVGVALDARRSALLRGEDLEVLLVDTEGGVPEVRLAAAARSVVEGSSLQAEDLLDGISLMRIHTISQFVGLSRSLTRYLETHPQTKLVIVDTVSFHVRPPSLAPDKQARVRILQRLKEEAQKCALRFTCAFVFTVQMATKFKDEDGIPSALEGDRAVLSAQLGDAWLPKNAYRIQIAYAGGTHSAPTPRRIATLLASPAEVSFPSRSQFGIQQSGSQGRRANGGAGVGRRVEFAIRAGLMRDLEQEGA